MSRISRNHFALVASALFALTISHAGLAQEHDEAAIIQVEAQPLATALQDFSEQSGLQVAYVATLAENVTSKGARAAATQVDALSEILDSTGLEFQFVNVDTVAIRPAVAADEGGDSEPGKAEMPTPIIMAQVTETRDSAERSEEAPDDLPAKSQSRKELEEITVVGTRIKGGRSFSPIVSITQEDMRLAGLNNLGEALRALPQNFTGGQNPGVLAGVSTGGFSNANFTGSSSINLRGLGPDVTLTLLNGSRMPYDGFSQATDVSVIPVAAIDRVDVLLDGASAIYGSDAVGGVANIVLKRDYQGAELSAPYGVATDGGNQQQQYGGIAGYNWDNWGSGGFLVTADYADNTAVRAGDRDYLRHLPAQDTTIYPVLTQKSGLFSGHQKFGENVELTLDAFYTERQQRSLTQFSSTLTLTDDPKATIRGLSSALLFQMPADWSLRIHGVAGENESIRDQRVLLLGDGTEIVQATSTTVNKTNALGVESEGPLLTLPGGDARLSVGGGYRKNSLLAASAGGEDRSRYGYLEINLPLVSVDQNIPLLTELSLSGAVRYEDYGSFGDVTTPKIGLIWSPTSDFEIRTTWGESFKVPTLFQQFGARNIFIQPETSFPGTPAGRTVLFATGGNQALTPETADVFTFGLVAHPEFLPNATAEIGWFDIDYTDRILTPITPQVDALTNPVFAPFVILEPTPEEQEVYLTAATRFVNLSGASYDPATVYAIVG